MCLTFISPVLSDTFHLMQYSGPSKDALAYVKWLQEDHRFSDILVQVSPPLSGHAFPRLKLRYKPSLVQASYMFMFSLPEALFSFTAYSLSH